MCTGSSLRSPPLDSVKADAFYFLAEVVQRLFCCSGLVFSDLCLSARLVAFGVFPVYHGTQCQDEFAPAAARDWDVCASGARGTGGDYAGDDCFSGFGEYLLLLFLSFSEFILFYFDNWTDG